jgi:hypothetical protein
MDRIRDETFRTKMGKKRDTLQETEKQQLRWSGHTMRLEDCRMQPVGKRRRGTPANTKKDGFRESMRKKKFQG